MWIWICFLKLKLFETFLIVPTEYIGASDERSMCDLDTRPFTEPSQKYCVTFMMVCE